MAETKTPIKILKALMSDTQTNMYRGNVHPPVIHSCASGGEVKMRKCLMCQCSCCENL